MSRINLNKFHSSKTIRKLSNLRISESTSVPTAVTEPGSMYIRWGRNVCADNAKIVYKDKVKMSTNLYDLYNVNYIT